MACHTPYNYVQAGDRTTPELQMFTTIKQLKAIDGLKVGRMAPSSQIYLVTYEGQRWLFEDKIEMLVWANKWLDHLLPA
jgi:hypothetical protein